MPGFELSQPVEGLYQQFKDAHGIELTEAEQTDVAVLETLRPCVLMALRLGVGSTKQHTSPEASPKRKQQFMDAVKEATVSAMLFRRRQERLTRCTQENILKDSVPAHDTPTLPDDEVTAMDEDAEFEEILAQSAIGFAPLTEIEHGQASDAFSGTLKRVLDDGVGPPSPTPKRHRVGGPVQQEDTSLTTSSNVNEGPVAVKLFKVTATTTSADRPTLNRSCVAETNVSNVPLRPTDPSAEDPAQDLLKVYRNGKSSMLVEAEPACTYGGV